MIETGATLDRPVVIATTDACLFFDVYETPQLGFEDQVPVACRHYYEGTMAWLKSAEPGTVVISMSDDELRNPEVGLSRTSNGAQFASADKNRVFRAGLETTVRELQNAGQRVVLTQAIPHFDGNYPYDPQRCWVLQAATAGCSASMPFEYVVGMQAETRDSIESIATQTGVPVLDLRTAICAENLCRSDLSGVIAYRDATHLSVEGSGLMAGYVRGAVEKADQ